MFSRINLRPSRFTFRAFLFSLFGLVVLFLVAGGVYLFKLKREESQFIMKPLGIFGEELAADTNKDYFNIEKRNVVLDLESSVGVRELKDGTIGIAGYVVELGYDHLIVQVKNKNIKIKTTPITGVIKAESEFPEGERSNIKGVDLGDIEKGDRVDVLCRQVGGSFEAIGILVFTR